MIEVMFPRKSGWLWKHPICCTATCISDKQHHKYQLNFHQLCWLATYRD